METDGATATRQRTVQTEVPLLGQHHHRVACEALGYAPGPINRSLVRHRGAQDHAGGLGRLVRRQVGGDGFDLGLGGAIPVPNAT
jgi:hypothetical protein